VIVGLKIINLRDTLLPMMQLYPMVTLLTVEFSPIRDPGPTITSSSRTHFLRKSFQPLQTKNNFFAESRVVINFQLPPLETVPKIIN
jgi:hypothetical protein